MKERIKEHLIGMTSSSGERLSGEVDDGMIQTCLDAIQAMNEGDPERKITLMREDRGYGSVPAEFLIHYAQLEGFLDSSV